jgi:hypothetical protein
VFTQAPTTAVGIAYMYNAEAQIAQTPTRDHSRATQALRVSSGNESARAIPFFSLRYLIDVWTARESIRREVLMVTDGLDRFNNIGLFNTYVEEAIKDAQRAGVLVYCLYAPALGHSSHGPAIIQGGRSNLAQLAEETGGEAYIGGPEPPASFEPYLADLSMHLSHQYRVTFLARPIAADDFQPVRFQANVPNVDLLAAYRFYLKAPEPLP